MKTQEIKNTEFKSEELEKAVKLMLDNGFRVFIQKYNHNRESKITYVHYQEGENLAYLQSDYSGLKYSTVHKSERGSGFGTGFGLLDSPYINLTIKDLREGFVFAPNWAKGDLTKIKKYKGIEDYLKNKINAIGETIELIK